jgi:hypothetical protein
MSMSRRQHYLYHLFTSIDAMLPSISTSALPSAAGTTTPADDASAPAVFNSDHPSWSARHCAQRGRLWS